jgi:hypothetical protein
MAILSSCPFLKAFWIRRKYERQDQISGNHPFCIPHVCSGWKRWSARKAEAAVKAGRRQELADHRAESESHAESVRHRIVRTAAPMLADRRHPIAQTDGQMPA